MSSNFQSVCYYKLKELDINIKDAWRTSQTIKQSWLIPFLPPLEHTVVNLSDLLDLVVPEDVNINPFLLASFANVSAVSLPPQFL